MLKRKAKSAAGKRALKKREPQAEEGAKIAIFLKGTSTSETTQLASKQLYALKKPDAIMFSKRNDVRPFEDVKPLEFFSQKNDAALFVLQTHSKKRPDNLVFVRMFEHELLDMFEVQVKDVVPLSNISNINLGSRPLIIFNGIPWEGEQLTMRSILLDFFSGDSSADKLDLRGISHLISFTLSEDMTITMKTHNILLKKSGGRIPRVELEEVGPSMVFKKRRVVVANMDMLKDALQEPMVNREKKQKNVSRVGGEKVGKVYVEAEGQDLSKLQTRKMKGLKKKFDVEDSDSEDSNDDQDNEDAEE